MKRPLLMSLLFMSMSLSTQAEVNPITPTTDFLEQINSGTWYEKEMLESYMNGQSSGYGANLSCSDVIKFDITNDDYRTIKPVINYKRIRFSNDEFTPTGSLDVIEFENASKDIYSEEYSLSSRDQETKTFDNNNYIYEFHDDETLTVYSMRTGELLNQYKRPNLTQGQTAMNFDKSIRDFASDCLANAKKPDGFICALPLGMGTNDNQISKTGNLYAAGDILKVILDSVDRDYLNSKDENIVKKLINDGGFCQLTSLQTATLYYYDNSSFHYVKDIYQGRYDDYFTQPHYINSEDYFKFLNSIPTMQK